MNNTISDIEVLENLRHVIHNLEFVAGEYDTDRKLDIPDISLETFNKLPPDIRAAAIAGMRLSILHIRRYLRHADTPGIFKPEFKMRKAVSFTELIKWFMGKYGAECKLSELLVYTLALQFPGSEESFARHEGAKAINDGGDAIYLVDITLRSPAAVRFNLPCVLNTESEE